MKKIVILYLAAAIMMFAAFAVSLVYFKSTIPDINTEPTAKLGGEGGYLNVSPVGLLCERAQKCAYNNGLLYLSSEQGIYECDTQTGITTELLSRGETEHYECINVYNGYIYAIYRQFKYGNTVFEGTTHFHIIRIDYNTHEITTLYSADDGREIKDMSISFDGVIYFTERDGYESAGLLPQNSILYSFKDGGVPALITQADWYYIDEKRLYITRYEQESDTEHLYYAPRKKPKDLSDTGLTVGTDMSQGSCVMFMPLGEFIYYTDESYDLCRYDISSRQSERIAGFEGEKHVYYYTVFDGRMLILVREQKPDGFWCYNLYYLDEANTQVRITGDEEFNEGKKYWFEYIEGICTFAGDDESFVIITYDQDMDSRVYTVDKQMNISTAMQSGEWDYLSFEKMKDGIQG